MDIKNATQNYLDNMNFVYGAAGHYGGDQSYPKNNIDEVRDIVTKYHPDFSEKEIKDFLTKLSSEGCTYTAFANTVFLYFREEEELYEKIFGLPFRDSYGYPNINALVVDFYSAMDNHNPLNFGLYKEDYVDNQEDYSDVKGKGVNEKQIEWRFELYMRKHGIRVDVKLLDKSEVYSSYEKIASKGPLVVSVNPTNFYNVYGKLVKELTGGHSMSVTGMDFPLGKFDSENGFLFRVSSWGDKYYIKPGAYSKYEYYQQVVYKKIPRSALRRWMIAHLEFPRPIWVKIFAWFLSR